MNRIIRSVLPFLTLLIIVFSPAYAQEDSLAGPTYEVQAGDTLWTIALNLHVSYDELLAANGLNANSSIIPGTVLEIPGLAGISGSLGTVDVPYGESLQSISRRYQVPEEDMIRLNRLTSPLELYVGVSAVVVGEDGISEKAGARKTLAPGQSALELAVVNGLNPWALIKANGEQGSWQVIPGEVLLLPGTESDGPGGFPEAIKSASFKPKHFVQGHTNVFQLDAPQGTELNGTLGDYPLSFFTKNGETYFALQGLHARENTGLKQLSISGMLPDGTPIAHTQMVEIESGNYPYEDVVGVPDETVGLDVTEEENQDLEQYTKISSGDKYWSEGFVSPVPAELSGAYASYFGGRRSYNGSGYYYFHTGLDFYGVMGQDIYAAAPGKVVFTGPLLLHGNTTLIDHGWGVYTLYAHQSEFLVGVGQQVSAGELIGRVGNTGRSIGPHLHFEVWVGGLQVDPLDWLEKTYP
ncbi:MAG: peptidoglycan DD-metalloendopeptidase family protein [Anaerolineales bacterium]